MMAEFIHTQSGVRVSVADGKNPGAGFQPAEKPKSEPKSKR